MLGERLVDLDELILRCRSEQAQQYIAEAVACYRAGAFRACIVATWVAVVFDVLHKLDELALTGDAGAQQKRDEYDQIRRTGDIRCSLRFEEELLALAKDQFELISPMEALDLARLKDDRNRCAHPSMTADGEVYHPSAELARYHIRNAVTSLLQQAPVQGKAAMDRLAQQFASDYFPTETDEALQQLAHGPLARPRQSLLRNVVIVLLKTLLLRELETRAFRRYGAALNAVRHMHRASVERVFEQNLLAILRNVEDAYRHNILRFLYVVPDMWHYLADDVIATLRAYVAQMPLVERAGEFHVALDNEMLRGSAQSRLGTLDRNTLVPLVSVRPRVEFIPRVIAIYEQAESFDYANRVASELLLPLVSFLTHEHVAALITFATVNRQIRGSIQFPHILAAIQAQRVLPTEAFQELLIAAARDYSMQTIVLPLLDARRVVALFEDIVRTEEAEGGDAAVELRHLFRTLRQNTILSPEEQESIRVHFNIRD